MLCTRSSAPWRLTARPVFRAGGVSSYSISWVRPVPRSQSLPAPWRSTEVSILASGAALSGGRGDSVSGVPPYYRVRYVSTTTIVLRLALVVKCFDEQFSRFLKTDVLFNKKMSAEV
jgi:hypothetical protein